MNIFDEPGRLALQRYQMHHGGMALFQAYIERRSADKQGNETHRAALVKEVESGTTLERHQAKGRELLMLQILSELDPVITDLMTFCKAPGLGADQLVNVRSALRIGKGHAPSDSKTAVRNWALWAEWIAAYGQMELDKIFISEGAIAKKIATKFGVSRSTAINHWKELKISEPGQAKWASETINRALGFKMHSARMNALPIKTPKGKQRITFGRGV